MVCSSGHAIAQTHDVRYQPVFTESFRAIPMWGHSASKACIVGNTRYFAHINNQRKPDLYIDSGNGWSRHNWLGTKDEAKQNPVLVCDSHGNVHVLYNRAGDLSLAHYKFTSNNAYPTVIDTSSLSQYAFNYLAATPSVNSDRGYPRIYLTSYDKNTPASARTFNVYHYDVNANNRNGVWSSARNLVLKYPIANTRNDGNYVYPVIAATGHSVFVAASLSKDNPPKVEFGYRKHWALWDSSYYGKNRVDHFYYDTPINPATGIKEPGHYETNVTHKYTVRPNAMKLNNDGTLFIASAIYGNNAPKNERGMYLHTYANRIRKNGSDSSPKIKIPKATGDGGMTVHGNLVVVVDKFNIHYSCDKGDSWEKIPNEFRLHRPTNTNQINSNYTHVMSDLVDDRWVDAFIGVKYQDTNTSKMLGHVMNIRIDTSTMCE